LQSFAGGGGEEEMSFLECSLENVTEIPFIFLSPHPSSLHSSKVILACVPHLQNSLH